MMKFTIVLSFFLLFPAVAWRKAFIKPGWGIDFPPKQLEGHGKQQTTRNNDHKLEELRKKVARTIGGTLIATSAFISSPLTTNAEYISWPVAASPVISTTAQKMTTTTTSSSSSKSSSTTYSTPSTISTTEDYLVKGIDELRRATMPDTGVSFVAILLSETIAGVVGGLSSRTVADLIGDVKIDSKASKAATTGTFFGARSVIRTACRLIGLPRPLAVGIASVSGSVLSELVKFKGREGKKKEKETDVSNDPIIPNYALNILDADAADTASSPSSLVSKGGVIDEPTALIPNNMNSTMETDATKSETISGREVLSDILKWLTYDLLSEAVLGGGDVTLPGWEKGSLYFILGGASSVIPSFIKHPIKLRKEEGGGILGVTVLGSNQDTSVHHSLATASAFIANSNVTDTDKLPVCNDNNNNNNNNNSSISDLSTSSSLTSPPSSSSSSSSSPSSFSFVWKESLEGACLFFSYEEIQDIIMNTKLLDDLLDRKFVFEEIVEKWEGML